MTIRTPDGSGFAAFILTHGRPDNVRTLRALELAGYTGDWYVVIDDDDPTGPEYRRLYGDRVLSFSKDEVEKGIDLRDNGGDRRAIVWARNACWALAGEVGVRWFVQLDDDYTSFLYRRGGKRDGRDVETYHGWQIRSLDEVLSALVAFLDASGAATIAMSQGGDHIGGAGSSSASTRLLRKAMNSFVLDAERPFTFPGRINEDVNAYVSLGALGLLFFTHTDLQLNQVQTQASEGGMTELYLDGGTYRKAMYSLLAAPSCVRVRTMGRYDRRLHHHVSWRHAVPKLLRESV